MSQSFSFPPPPPPPPKPAQTAVYSQHNSRGGPRGRGIASNGSYAPRGRGQYPPCGGGQRGGYNKGGYSMNHQQRGGQQSYNNVESQRQSPSVSYQPRGQNPAYSSGQKRNHQTAFTNNKPTNNQSKARPLAPPPVPSFGIDLESLLPKKPPVPSSNTSPIVSAKKSNFLGLTPAAPTSDSESSDDENEEDKLTHALSSAALVQFEYKGQTSTLTNHDEVAAWLAERRKNWPTEAKREVARKEAEEKKRKWGEERAARAEKDRKEAEKRRGEREKQRLEREKSQVRRKLLQEHIAKAKKDVSSGDGTQTAAQMKAEKLKQKAEKIAKQLKDAEDALRKQKRHTHAGDVGTDNQDDDLELLLAQVDQAAQAQMTHVDGQASDVDSTDSDSDDDLDEALANNLPADDTSTSGSSSDSDLDSDSDAPPEASTSKRLAPDKVLPPVRKPTDARLLCTNFAKTGRCKFGRRCHFKHERPNRADSMLSKGGKRKGLYQIMVEKEKEEERRKVVQVIIALGERGVFDAPETTMPEAVN